MRARYGYTSGSGKTNSQPSLTYGLINPNISYQINQSRPTDFSMLNPASGQPIDLGKVSSFVQISPSGGRANSQDRENYLHLDGDYQMKGGFLTSIKWGGRASRHASRPC